MGKSNYSDDFKKAGHQGVNGGAKTGHVAEQMLAT